MGKKGSKKKPPNALTGSQASISLREESTGKKQTNINAKTMLKLEHIKNLSLWASGEASVPSLGALFGHRLAASTEALGVPPDPSLFTCQRCESVLQPGYNCTIRIEKSRAKLRRRRKKPNNSSQNNVVYSCHFCSHRNLIRGTPLGHMKAIRPQKAKTSSKSGPRERTTLGNIVVTKAAALAIVPQTDPVVSKYDPMTKIPETPLVTMGFNLLDEKKDEVNETAMVEAEAEAEAASAVVPKYDLVTKSPATTRFVEPGPTLLDGEKNEVEAKPEAALGVVAKADPVVPKTDTMSKSPATPLMKQGPTLLERKKKKRNRSGSKKAGESEGGSAGVDEEKGANASSKRKRKSWTSLKEIVKSSEHDSGGKFKNLTVPFFL